MKIVTAICTWNRAELLEKCLEHLCQIDRGRDFEWELVVVDNNSTDNTAFVLERFDGRLPLRALHEHNPGLSNARNRALQEARDRFADYILWTDDDVLVDTQWLVEFASTTSRFPDAGVFGGPIEPWFPVAPDKTLLEVFPCLQIGFCGVDHRCEEGPIPRQLDVLGANFGLRLSAIGDLRFNPSLGPAPTADGGGGDELGMILQVRAAGHSVVWNPRMRVQHYVDPRRMTLPYLLNFTRLKGRESVLFSLPDTSPRIFGAPRWFWRRWSLVIAGHYFGQLVKSGFSGPSAPRSGPRCSESASGAVKSLTWSREKEFLRGMRQGYAELRELDAQLTLHGTVAPES